jgi:hypothetical protein
MGTTTATAILPPLLSPPLALSLGLIAEPEVVDEGADDDDAGCPTAVEVTVSTTVWVLLEGLGVVVLEVLDELTGAELEEDGVVELEVVCGGGEELLVGVVLVGGGDCELVVVVVVV